ncbi:DUF4249 domain-containing protein [Sphingobacterium sp. UBA5670]|uniref:DUF4249 domain-containing protein n=1 Tax=Sphingobacterium sp. UBA5670 TaxID=1947502 RepID=UPI0025D7F459|nr:DUF4249 domain-containing protein [Sphingobacterium sp. UBA5670]
MKKILAIIPLFLFLLASCEKEIDIDLNNSDPQIVIEGAITDQPGPYYVKISKSVNFSEPNSYPPVSGAYVTITDNNGNIDVLTEIEAGLYQTNTTLGIPGNTYNLNVSIDQVDYFATSTMPQKVMLDSLQFELWSGPDGDDNYVTIPVYTDPPTLGNSYRFIMTINGVKDDTYYVDNDIIGNGVTNTRALINPDTDIALNDTVEFEMRCIDTQTYVYFNTLSQISGGGPNGGVTPSNPPNNITGGRALGIFSAYTTQTLTQQVQ